MKHFLFLTVFVGCFVISEVRASEQGLGEKETLLIFWKKKKNGQEPIKIPYNPNTVTLAFLNAAVEDRTKIRPERQELTIARTVKIGRRKPLLYSETNPLNSLSGFDDQKKLQKVLTKPGISITVRALKHGPDKRKQGTFGPVGW